MTHPSGLDINRLERITDHLRKNLIMRNPSDVARVDIRRRRCGIKRREWVAVRYECGA